MRMENLEGADIRLESSKCAERVREGSKVHRGAENRKEGFLKRWGLAGELEAIEKRNCCETFTFSTKIGTKWQETKGNYGKFADMELTFLKFTFKFYLGGGC